MRLAFSVIVTIVLLAIYVYLVIYGLSVVQCVTANGCTDLTEADFNDRMASSLALIGGLVSALVIAELAVTKPGEAPVARIISSDQAKTKNKKILQIVTGLYLLVWLIAGLAAFLFGYLTVEPDILPPLADLGQAWLGLAVGAGYAYFGIKQ